MWKRMKRNHACLAISSKPGSIVVYMHDSIYVLQQKQQIITETILSYITNIISYVNNKQNRVKLVSEKKLKTFQKATSE